MRTRFDAFVLDSSTRQLERSGRYVHLSPKAFDLLALLLAERPGVVSKEMLRDRLWGGTNVVDANLNNLISEIRAALDDEPQDSKFVRTVHRVGYAFCAEAVEDDEPPPGRQSLCWLVWGDRTIGVPAGDTTIGRDPESGVWIDAPGVSRRHARLQVNDEDGEVTVTIEDLGSTNGTFVETRRVTSPVTLDDAQVLRVGDATLTYRTRAATSAPTRKIRKKN